MAVVRIAAVSMEVAVDTAANMEKIERFIKEAASRKADLVVFPEFSLQGLPINLQSFDPEIAKKVHEIAEPVPDGEHVQRIIALAKEYDLYVAWGMIEQNSERFDVCHNTCVLVGPEGYIGKYSKVHQAMAERLYLYQGDGTYPVFDTRIGKIGLSLCFDKAFPEVSRILAIEGAQIILSPTAWRCTTRSEDDNDVRLANTFSFARAMENMVFFVEATHCGPQRMGHSRIIGPNPNQVCATTDWDEGMAFAEVDIEGEILKARLSAMAGSDLLKDRRPGTYGKLLENNRYILNYGTIPEEN